MLTECRKDALFVLYICDENIKDRAAVKTMLVLL